MKIKIKNKDKYKYKVKEECVIPKDVSNSLDRFVDIVDIVEGMISLPIDSIFLELCINIDRGIDAISDTFELHNPYDMTLKSYIKQRKISEAIKAISKTKDKDIVKSIIWDICQCSKYDFDKRIHRVYKLRSKDIMNKGRIDISLVEKLDAKMIKSKYIDMINDIHTLAHEGYINVEIRRTKISIKK